MASIDGARDRREHRHRARLHSKHPRRRRGKSREVIMAPAAPASLTSSPIGRTARNTAELDDRKTGLWRCQDLASATPSRSMLPQSGSTHSWPSSTPTRGEPGSESDPAFVRSLERTDPEERRATGHSWIHFRGQDVRNPLVERPFNWFKSPSDTHRSSRRSHVTSLCRRAALDWAPTDLAQFGWRRRPVSCNRSLRAAR